MQWRRPLRPAAAAFVLAFALACGAEDDVTAFEGDGDRDAAPAEGPDFVAVDIAYDEAPPVLRQGQDVGLRNSGAIFHNVVLDDSGEVVLAAEGGETDTWTVELESGDYDYYCDVTGHREAGMEGSFTVED